MTMSPRFKQQGLFTKKQLVEAFVVGVLRADTWYDGYKAPAFINVAINDVAREVEVFVAEGGGNALRLTPEQGATILRDCASRSDAWKRWGAGSVLGLDAVFLNMAVALAERVEATIGGSGLGFDADFNTLKSAPKLATEAAA